MARPGTPAAARAACVRGERASAALPAAGLRSGERRAARLPPRTVPLRFPAGLAARAGWCGSRLPVPAAPRESVLRPRATGAARTASSALGRASARSSSAEPVLGALAGRARGGGRWRAANASAHSGGPRRGRNAHLSGARTRGVGGGGGENVWTTRPAGHAATRRIRSGRRRQRRRRYRRRGRQRACRDRGLIRRGSAER